MIFYRKQNLKGAYVSWKSRNLRIEEDSFGRFHVLRQMIGLRHGFEMCIKQVNTSLSLKKRERKRDALSE